MHQSKYTRPCNTVSHRNINYLGRHDEILYKIVFFMYKICTKNLYILYISKSLVVGYEESIRGLASRYHYSTNTWSHDPTTISETNN